MYVLNHQNYKSYFNRILCFHKPIFLFELLQVGLPMGVMCCFEVAYFFAVTLMMGKLGSIVLAANQVVLQYLGLFISVTFSIAQAITVRIGHLLGAKEIKDARHAAYIGILIASILMFIVALFYWFSPSIFISVDFDVTKPENLELVNYIKQFFIFSAIFQIFEAMRISLFGALRSLKDTKFTLFISILSFWFIAFPMGYCLSKFLEFGGEGFWIAMIIGAITSVILLFWRFNLKVNVIL